MPAGVGNLARPELLIVVFSLLADSQNDNRLSILDFAQCHVACRAKWDDDFTEKRIRILSLATGERKFLKEGPRAINNVQRPLCGFEVLLDQEGIQAFETGFRCQSEVDAEAHPLRFEASRIPRNESMTSSLCPE